MPHDVPTEPKPGLLTSLRTLMATLVAITCTRLEILIAEVEEEKARLGRMALLGIATIFFAAMALIFATLLVLALFWDDHRIFALYAISVGYTLVAFGTGWRLRRDLQKKSKLFSVSLDELRKDRTELDT
jgi:uncharacterized membrane protein YqjE